MGLPDAIPDNKLPQCWSDDVRMNALFAPFRLKSSNPESWDMKMKFWSDMLRVWCKCNEDPIVTAADAKFAFQRKGRTPACIDIVIEEMFREGQLSPTSKYQQILHNGPEGWVRWGARLAFKPAAFALTAVTSLLPARQAIDSDGLPKASIDPTQRFVVESVVKDQATELLHNYPPGLERIGTVEELMRNVNWQRSRDTFEVLLGFLVSQGIAVKKGDVIKLADPNKKASPITETDEALVQLMCAETRLESDAARLTRDAAIAAADARAALKLGNKLAAKNHLRRKHKAESRAARCEGALDNVRQLLHQMRDVNVNSTIVDTYRTSSEAMKRTMKDGGLDADAVHDTIDDLKDVLEEYNEVEKALSSTIDDTDADLEEELRLLLAGGGAGGGVGETAPGAKLAPAEPPRRVSERSDREFVFDGEENLIAQLNSLGVEDASPRQRQPVPVKVKESAAAPERPAEPKTPPVRASKPWYPPAGQTLQVDDAWNNNQFDDLRQDERLHPGQPLDVDFTTPPRLYGSDFQVRDHKLSGGVWLFNTSDGDTYNLGGSTEYFKSESPGKAPPPALGAFVAAPGGERKKTAPAPTWPADSAEKTEVDDLERRLKNLRGFNL